MAFGLTSGDIVLRLAVIENSVAVRFNPTTETEIGPTPRQSSNGGSQPDIPLADIGDAILPATTIPQEALRSVPTRDSNIQPVSKHSILRILLTSRRSVTASWGTTVQAILLTAFDSVISPPSLIT